MMYFEIIL